LIIDDVRDRAAWLKASLELADFDVIGVLAWEQVDEHSIQAASSMPMRLVATRWSRSV
jgi:hypothetical protein